MFGWPAGFVNGNMFTALHGERMILRLPGPAQSELLKVPGASEFEPMPGRKMAGYVVVPRQIIKDDTQARTWLRRALEHAETLPAKEKKKSATKKGPASAKV